MEAQRQPKQWVGVLSFSEVDLVEVCNGGKDLCLAKSSS